MRSTTNRTTFRNKNIKNTKNLTVQSVKATNIVSSNLSASFVTGDKIDALHVIDIPVYSNTANAPHFDGSIIITSTDAKLNVCLGGVWKSVQLT